MKKLKIVFDDNSKIVYTMKDSVPYLPYFERHLKQSMKSAVLTQYPLKNNKPINLLEEGIRFDLIKKEIKGFDACKANLDKICTLKGETLRQFIRSYENKNGMDAMDLDSMQDKDFAIYIKKICLDIAIKIVADHYGV